MSEDKEQSETKSWPGDSEEAYPELYTTIPTQPTKTKPGQLTEKQLKQYFEDGYVIIEDILDKSKLDECKEDINIMVDKLAKDLYKAGKISKLYDELGFYHRLDKINEEFPGALIVLLKRGEMPKAIRDLWSCDKLLNIMEQLLGTEDILGHPVWNLRPKCPGYSQMNVPWHQDNAYFGNGSYKVLIPTVWVPLLDAEAANGCMQMVKGAHRRGKIAKHKCCFEDTWQVWVNEEEIEHTLGVDLSQDVVTCPVPYGGILLFNNMIPHHSLPNRSDIIRWTLDLRWQRADEPVDFYGVKEGIRMRSSKDPDYQIDWEPFISVNRMDEEKKNLKTKEKEDDQWDSTIQGPWMLKWEMINTNRHTARLNAENA